METRRPLIAEIKRNSLDDGPGIRSVVFFKGCPLKCVWCHNPECIGTSPELLYNPELCIGCGGCREVCPEGAIGEGGPSDMDRKACNLCGKCIEECPSGALNIVGAYYEPDRLVEILDRDKAFYENSGGGVTLSGGEPTLAMDYSAEVAEKLKSRGIHVLLETCGDFDWDRFASKLMPHVDLVYVDMKLADGELHKKYTGRDNGRIKQNIERLIENGVEHLVRVPLIPEVTATPENLEALAGWMMERQLRHVALLPYNPLWLGKSRGLGREPRYSRKTFMTKDEREQVKRIFKDFKLERDL